MDFYHKVKDNQTRWISFENPTGAKGQGGKENDGGKGHAFDIIRPGETIVLCDIEASGVINRIWMTLGSRNPQFFGSPPPDLLRSLRIEMFWDHAQTPSVSAPLGDFFGTALSRRTPFECALFADPEGRSFVSYAPMPFRKRARITLTNDNDHPERISLFYKINYSLQDLSGEDILYFHAYWNREKKTVLRRDYTILPRISGEGRYLGANIGVIPLTRHWWGEGEVKIYLDGDQEYPTLVGTGSEDYVGTGYGLGKFCHLYQVCTYKDEKEGTAFYRYHIPDPVYFHSDCRVTMQQIGCTQLKSVPELLANPDPIILATIHKASEKSLIYHLLEEGCTVKYTDDIFNPEMFCCYYRQDDWSSTAYFYLDKPENGLPPIAGCQDRL